MKLLFVCGDRYPQSGACTNLLNKLFFDGGLLKSNDIHVATYKYCIEDRNEENYKGIVVHRFFSSRFIPMSELKKKPISVRLLCKGMLEKLQRKFFSVVFKQRELDRGRIMEYKDYLFHLCEKYKYEFIVGVAGCYELAIAAKEVASEKNIKYILYQVDPFTDNAMYNEHYVEKRYAVEKDLYLNAKKVFTTDLILSSMMERMKGEKLGNVEVMEFPGVSVDLNQKRKLIEKKEYINCVFSGRIYKGIRNPTQTIELFDKFPRNIKLKLYGVTEKELKDLFLISPLPSNVECCGLVSVEEADDAIKNADILVNIGNTMTNQVPSKLFGYISTGKPILNICANHNCPSKKYLEQYPYAMSIDEDNLTDGRALKNVLDFLLSNAGLICDLSRIKVLYERCTPGYAAKQMQEAFIQSI